MHMLLSCAAVAHEEQGKCMMQCYDAAGYGIRTRGASGQVQDGTLALACLAIPQRHQA